MSSLRFTEALRIEGLPEEAAEEWVGLEVGLASIGPWSFGYLGPAPAREFDEELKVFTDKTFCDLQKVSNVLMKKCLFISIEKLIEACKRSPPRPHLLAWLLKEDPFQYFVVSDEVAEYLP